MWTVYILECEDGSFYTGVASDLNRRLKEHRVGTSHYTGYNPPVRLVYQESYPTKTDAENREAQIKRWSKAKKSALIDGDHALLRKLSQSRD